MALTARAKYEQSERKLLSLIVATAVRIFDGALVAVVNGGADDGRAKNWANASADDDFFMGLAIVSDETGVSANAGESVLGNTAGTVRIAVDIGGAILKKISVTGVAATSVGDEVYATDENTFTMTQSGGQHAVGRVTRFYSGTTADVMLYTPNEFRARYPGL